MTDHVDPLATELARLPVPPLDPDFASVVQRAARAELAQRPATTTSWWDVLAWYWREASVPTLLLLTGSFYAIAAAQQLLRSYLG